MRLKGVRGWQGSAINWAILFAIWEVAGRFDLIASGALPASSEVAVQFWTDRLDYGGHVEATLIAAVTAAVAFTIWLVPARLARSINVALFALPPIALVPILIIAFQGMTPRIILAAVAVYIPTMTSMVVGLRQIDPRSADLVNAYAGGDWAIMR